MEPQTLGVMTCKTDVRISYSLKIAKDQMIADDSLNTVMIVGGYRNIDLIDYMDPNMSFIYDVSPVVCILKRT